MAQRNHDSFVPADRAFGMDPQHVEMLLHLWDFEKTAASPENNNDGMPFMFEFNQPEFSRNYRIPDNINSSNNNSGIRAPLSSPTNLSSGSHGANQGLFPSVLQPLTSLLYPQPPPTITMPSAKYGNMQRPPITALPQFSFFEESTSTDATPESSDVEDEGRPRKKKRTKALLSEEQATKHTEDAQRFPLWLTEMRGKLSSESPDGRVHEPAAVSALIQEFRRCDELTRFTMPSHCEQWLKLAAESVQERRQQNKGMRKKRSVDALVNGGPADKFYCTFCAEHEAKAYKTQEGLNLHIRNKHEADKPWKCFAPGCTVSFVRQADLRMHLIRMHSPQRPFPCKVPFCLKAFAGVSELRRHVKVDHRNVVQHLCGVTNPPF